MVITSNAPKWVEQGSNLVEHYRTHLGGYVKSFNLKPFRPLESATGARFFKIFRTPSHQILAKITPQKAYNRDKNA